MTGSPSLLILLNFRTLQIDLSIFVILILFYSFSRRYFYINRLLLLSAAVHVCRGRYTHLVDWLIDWLLIVWLSHLLMSFLFGFCLVCAVVDVWFNAVTLSSKLISFYININKYLKVMTKTKDSIFTTRISVNQNQCQSKKHHCCFYVLTFILCFNINYDQCVWYKIIRLDFCVLFGCCLCEFQCNYNLWNDLSLLCVEWDFKLATRSVI